MKKLVVGIEGATAAQEEGFAKWLTDNGLGYWHWIPNFWILHSLNDTFAAANVRDKIMEIFPTMNTLVIELKDGTHFWGGYGPATEQRNMYTWLRKNL